MSESKTGLSLLRDPFPAHQISKLPKPTKQQTEEVKADFKKGIRCPVCQAWHHPSVVHLDYVGHAALTDRLLDADAAWQWEPLAVTADGLPRFDESGGLWIKLTVCGTTRLGYGHAGDKQGGDAVKEIIGDCLVRGTRITTSRGIVPIESVQVGDMVPTRSGWCRVTEHWLSRPDAQMLTVRLTDGRSITGTPHHRVPTAQGTKRIKALRNGDMLFSWQETEKRQAPKTSNGVAEFIGATRRIEPCTDSATSWQRQRRALTCIGTSTNLRMGAVLRAAGMCTMPMVIGTTTILATLLRSLLQITLQPMHSRMRASFALATNAGTRTALFSSVLAGAAPHAKNVEDDSMAWPTSDRSRLRLYEPPRARSAEPSSFPRNPGLDFAEVCVAEVTDAGRGEVWNLSVGETHEYVANGILVCNSLRNAAMRFGAALDLWHKGQLHEDEPEAEPPKKQFPSPVTSALEGETFTDDQTKRLSIIANSLVDLCTLASEGEDVDYKIWELMEPLETGERLYLWELLKPQSAVRTKVKAICVEQERLKRANPTGLKKVVSRVSA